MGKEKMQTAKTGEVEWCEVRNLLGQKVVLNYVLDGALYSLTLRPREAVRLRKSKEAVMEALGQYVFSKTVEVS